MTVNYRGSVRILVTGATGYVGSRLVTALLAGGCEVVVAVRNMHQLKRFGWHDGVDAVELDARNEASAGAAFAAAGPIDVAYYLVHGIGQPGFRQGDNQAAANVAAAARDANVRRIVYLGGFVPDDEVLSEHLTSRAEVAAALSVDRGPEVVWLGAAMIIGSGSTSFEILRYVGDRFVLIPMPYWVDNPIDPISICDVLHYLSAAADEKRVPAGAYDICGPQTASYRDLVTEYVRASRTWRAPVPVRGVNRTLMSRMTAAALPLPGALAADLVASLDHPMTASEQRLRDHVPDPTGGLVPIGEAIARSLAKHRPRAVNALADPHHLADSDPAWAGGDALRIRRLARPATPPIVRPALSVLNVVPGPVAGAVRTGLDALVKLAPKARFA